MTNDATIVPRCSVPSGPQIGCDECFELLDIYVERRDRRQRRRRRDTGHAHAPRGLPGLPRGARVAAALVAWRRRPCVVRTRAASMSSSSAAASPPAPASARCATAGYDGT